MARKKTKLMKQFEKKTGKNAVWNGKSTKAYKKWKKNNTVSTKKKIKAGSKKRTTKRKRKPVKKAKQTLEQIEEKREEVAESNMKKLNELLENMKTDMFNRRKVTHLKRIIKEKQRRGTTGYRRPRYGFRAR